MNGKRFLLFILILLLTSSCTLWPPAAGNEIEPTRLPPPAETESSPTTAPPPASPQLHTCPAGGFTFELLPDFQIAATASHAVLIGPHAAPLVGPAVTLIGGIHDEDYGSIEQMIALFQEKMDRSPGAELDFSQTTDTSVAGTAGLEIEIDGVYAGQDIHGRIIAVNVAPDQTFALCATAPAAEWTVFAHQLDDLLKSLTFSTPVLPTPHPTPAPSAVAIPHSMTQFLGN